MKYYLIILLFFSETVLANEVIDKIPAVDPVSSSYLIKLTLGLGFILLLIFGLAWLMKKMQLTQHSHNGLIQIVSAISVGQRDRIALVQVGDEQVLIGMTPGQIVKLHTLKESVTVEPKLPGDSKVAQGSFAEKFNQLINREKNNAD